MERVLIHILGRYQNKLPPSPTGVVILLTPAGAGGDGASSLFQVLLERGIVPEVWSQGTYSPIVPWSVRQLKGNGEEWLDQMKQRTRVLLLPTPSLSFLARLTEWEDEDPFQALTLHCLLHGKRVGVPMRIFDPAGWKRVHQTGTRNPPPLSLQRKLQRLLAEIQALGVNFLAKETIVSWLMMESCEQRELVTAEDVEGAASHGDQVIVVSREALITPLASDTAKERGIRIKKQ
ncbi:hypothetical protein [Marininema halotolerans]|uniref:Uncharacterized protein n=1 Tax=Marininema halotolerans TaxID=1155944 RepID=A0A1I6SUI3_9BACL|nr:hypothetical protein [Marininema halotolerans]SFS80604.1 hypothetical protein SAMN05444972_10849 [Marininema halotolerans]